MVAQFVLEANIKVNSWSVSSHRHAENETLKNCREALSLFPSHVQSRNVLRIFQNDKKKVLRWDYLTHANVVINLKMFLKYGTTLWFNFTERSFYKRQQDSQYKLQIPAVFIFSSYIFFFLFLFKQRNAKISGQILMKRPRLKVCRSEMVTVTSD